MRAKLIYENIGFKRRNKPKENLVLGKEYYRKELEKIGELKFINDNRKTIDRDLNLKAVENFILIISTKFTSNLNSYLPWNDKFNLYQYYKKGYNIAVYITDKEEDFDTNLFLNAGWEKYWGSSHINSQFEWIFIKKPEENES